MSVLRSVKNCIKSLPIISSFTKTNTWASMRYKYTQMTDERTNSTFTGFYRLPTQFEALAIPVMDFLFDGKMDKELIIIVIGCSNGSEAYTIASVLHYKNIKFKIYGFDINEEMVKKADRAVYLHDEVYNNEIITEEFIKNTFDKKENEYTIKKELKKYVTFSIANALDVELKNKIGTADILFAQNFLFHLKPSLSKKALYNLATLLNPRSVFYVDGVDLDIRQSFSKSVGLEPLDYKIEEIHKEAGRARADGWPHSYWGLEPLNRNQKHWKSRYSTILLKS